MWVSWGESNLELIAPNGTTMGTWDANDFDFPIREILEFNGEVLFATEDGVARYNETSNQWLTMWEEGNGLPNNAGSRIYELWTDGTHLVTGGGDVSGFGQFQGGAVSHWDGSTWNQFDLGQSGTPNGYPLSMAMCGGVLNIGIYANNGGVARLDLANSTITGSFTRADWNEDYGEVSGVACDATDTLLGLLQSLRQPTVYQATEYGGIQLAMRMEDLCSDTELVCRAAISSVEDSPLLQPLATRMLRPVLMAQAHL